MPKPRWLTTRAELEEKAQDAALIRQLVSSGKISPESGLKMTLLSNGQLGYLEPTPNPIEAPTANGVPMVEENAAPQMRTRPLTFVSNDNDAESQPLFQRNRDTGKLERVPPTPGLKDKKQIMDFNPPSEKEPKETIAVSLAKERHKKYDAMTAAGEPMTATFLKQINDDAKLLGLVKVKTRGEAKKTFWRGKPTGEFEAGLSTYKPVDLVTEDEWDFMAEEELVDAFMKKYPDRSPKDIRSALTSDHISAAKKQLKGTRRK